MSEPPASGEEAGERLRPTPAPDAPAAPAADAADGAPRDREEARRISVGDPDVADPRSLPAFTHAAPPSRRMTILKGLLVLAFSPATRPA